MARVNKAMRGTVWCVAAVGLLALALWPLAALAQPPLLAVAATALIGAGAIAGVTLSTVVFAGLTVSNLIFISTMVYGVVKARSDARKAANGARDAYNAGLSDRNASIVSADNPLQIILGRATVGPAYVAVLTSGDKDQYKHVVAVWAGHQCDAIEDITIAGVSIGALDGSGFVTGGKWFKGETRTVTETKVISGAGVITVDHTIAKFLMAVYETGSGDSLALANLTPDMVVVAGSTITISPAFVAEWAGRTVQVNYDWASGTARLRARHYLGTASQTADADLLAELPGDWSSTDRLRGLCYSVFRLDLNEPEFQGGPPQFRARIRGALVWDPRTSTTAWSNNAALCTAHYLRAEYGKRATEAQVLSAPLITAANGCDGVLVVGGDNVPRYTVDGAFRTDADTDGVLDQLCQAMAGFATFTGAWHVQAGVYVAPTATLTDADNAGSIEVVAAPAGAEVFNGVRGRFFDPARFDEMTDYPPYQNASFKTEDGGEDLWTNLDLPYTATAWRAHNLARIFTERSRGMQLVYPSKMRGLLLKVGQRVTLTNSFLSIDAQVFRVVKREFKLGQAVMLTLQQDDPTYWDTADAPASLPSPSQPGFDPFVVAPVSNLQATSDASVTLKDDDGTVISRVRLTYDESPDALVQSNGALQIEYRLETATAWQRPPEAPGNSTQTQLLGLKDGRTYIIRARWRNGLGAVSDWRTARVLTASPSAIGVGMLRLASTAQAFSFDGAGAASPTVQTVTLTALLSNITGTATFTATLYDAAGGSLGAATLGGSGNARTLAVADFGAAAYCVVQASRSGYSDQVTLFRLSSSGISRAVIYIYRRATSTPALPTADVTYNFNTNVVTGLNNGWTATVPSGTDPLYLAVGSASGSGSTDTIASNEWTAPVVFVPASGGAGADGGNTATVFLFQRTTTSTAPSLPSAAVTYTFAGGALSGLTNGWTAAVPASGGGYLWVTTATAFSTSGSDSIPTTEWAAARIMARDGEAASAGISSAVVLLYRRAASTPSGPSADVTYNFSTGAITGLTNSWVASPPSGSNPLWVISASASDVDVSDTIAPAEWTAPVIMTQNGADGANTATVYLFRRNNSTSAPAVPGSSLTYTFDTGVLSGTLGSWSQTVPAISGGAYLWVTTATAFSVTNTDTIPTGEWAAPQQMAVNGADAPLLMLTATAQTFTFDGNNDPSPAEQTISFTAYLANLSGTAVFSCTKYRADNTVISTPTLGGSGNTRTFTEASFGGATYAVITATLSGITDQITVVRLRDGANGLSPISGFLSNQAHTVATNSDGSGGSYGSAGGDFKVYEGTTEVTTGVVYSVVSSSGISGMAINASTGIYSLTGTTADSGTATLRAVYGGVTIDRPYSISRSRAGNDGANAEILTLKATATSISFDTEGTATPAVQTITFTAVLSNLTGTATWGATKYDSAGASLGAATLGGSGNVRTMTVGQFGAAAYVVVTAIRSGFEDQITVSRVSSGPPAARALDFGASAFKLEFASAVAADAYVRINRDGTVDKRQGASGSWVSTGNWYQGGTNPGDDHRVFASATGNALQAGTLDAWLPLSSNRQWQLRSPAGSYIEKLTKISFIIAKTSSDTPQCTGFGNLFTIYEP